MRPMGWLAIALVAAGCSRPTPEMQVVTDAATAMGGRDRILAVQTIVLEGEGSNFNLGQNMSPEADLPVFKVAGYKRTIDLANGRWRLDQMRTAQFPTANTAPQRQMLGLDGDVAINFGPTGEATRGTDAVAKDRKAELLHHPVGFLRAALADGAQLGNAREYEGRNAVDLTTPDGTFTLAIDSGTKLPAQIVSMTYNVNLGDVAVETEFGGYQDVDGLKLPTEIETRLDRSTTADIRVTKQTINGEAGDLAAPAAVKSASAAPPAANVVVEEVAPGLWYLTGQSHHSLVVEFADHLTLVEVPQNETRSLAVIAKARELNPKKPLTNVVVTHHHFDHSGGVRAAVAEGLTVVTHEANKAFFEDVVARKHTIVQDALAKNPKPLVIETVSDELVMKDATRTMGLYHIEGNPHAATLLMVHFPKERLLSVADVYTPPAPNPTTMPGFPFAPNLAENVSARKLQVDRLLPIHGRIVPYADVVAAAKAQTATTTTQ